MALMVQWRLMFRVGNQAAFDRCLALTIPLFEATFKSTEGRPYWKVPELWECSVEVPLSGESTAELILESLLTSQRLATGWTILGSLSADCAVGFSGVFAAEKNEGASKVPGLEWASFDVVSSDRNTAIRLDHDGS